MYTIGIIILMLGIVAVFWWYMDYIGQGQGQPVKEGFRDAVLGMGGYDAVYADNRNLYHRQTPTDGDPNAMIFANEAVVEDIPNFASALHGALKTVSSMFNSSFPDAADNISYVARLPTDNLTIRLAACTALGSDVQSWLASQPTLGCGWLHVPDATTGEARNSMALLASDENEGAQVYQGTQIGGQSYSDYVRDKAAIWYPNTPTGRQTALASENTKRCKRIKSCGTLSPTEGCYYNTSLGHGVPYDRTQALPNISGATFRPENCSVNQQFCAGATTSSARRECIGNLLDVEGFPVARSWIREYVKANDTIAATLQSQLENALAVIYERANTPTNNQFGIAAAWKELRGDEKVGASPSPWQGTWHIGFRGKIQYLKGLRVSYDPILADLSQMCVDGVLSNGRVYVPENYYAQTAINARPSQQTFATAILQNAWLATGCQAAGSDFPTAVRSGASFTEIQAEYQKLYKTMFRADTVTEQTSAVKKCLNTAYMGTEAADLPTDFCNERGIEYFVFEGEGASAILIGHMYSALGLLVDPTARVTTYKKAQDMRARMLEAETTPRSLRVSYKARTMISVPAATTLEPDREWKNAAEYTITVNKVPQVAGKINLPEKTRNLLEFGWSGLRGGSWGAPRYDFIDLNLDIFQLFQASTKPLVSLDFFQGTFLDSNRVAELESTVGVQLQAVGTPVAKTGLRWAATGAATGANDLALKPAIRRDLLQVITQRLFIPAGTTSTTLFILGDTAASYKETCELRGQSLTYTVTKQYASQTFTIPLTLVSGVTLQETWFNLAIQYTLNAAERTMGLTVYVDQKEAGKAAPKVLWTETFNRAVTVYIPKAFNGYMGWLHMYDRVTAAAVEGFANPGDPILEQEADFDPLVRPAVDLQRGKPPTPSYMVNQVPNYARSTPEPSTTVTPSVTDASVSCPFEPVTAPGIAANYAPKALYEQRFTEAGGKREGPGPFNSARECQDACKDTCIAYTFNSKDKTCTTYTVLREMTTTAEPNAFSVVLSEPNKSDYASLKAATLQNIDNYKQLRQEMRSKELLELMVSPATGDSIAARMSQLGNRLFGGGVAGTPSAAATTLPTEDMIRVSDPRTDAEIETDRKAVSDDRYMNALDCLNGIKIKYAMN